MWNDDDGRRWDKVDERTRCCKVASKSIGTDWMDGGWMDGSLSSAAGWFGVRAASQWTKGAAAATEHFSRGLEQARARSLQDRQLTVAYPVPSIHLRLGPSRVLLPAGSLDGKCIDACPGITNKC